MSTTAAPDRATRYRRLRAYNLFNGVAHLAQVIAILALTNDFALPVTASFLSNDPVAAVVRGEFPPVEVITTLKVGLLIAIFLAFAAADHLLTALPLRRWYERKLDERANYARWIEYSISSSIMVVLIAAFVGIWDVAAIVGIFAVNSAMIVFGLIMERRESVDDPDMSAFWWGTVFGLVPWLLLVFYVVQGGGAPSFVYVILVVQFLLFWSFGMNMWLQYRQVGRWKDYVYGEYVYITLSLAAKTLLAWLVFANVLTVDVRS